MESALIKWSGSLSDETGWGRELYDYFAGTKPEDIAVGRLPASAQRELGEAASDGAGERLIRSLATLLIAAQEVYARKTEGVITEAIISQPWSARP